MALASARPLDRPAAPAPTSPRRRPGERDPAVDQRERVRRLARYRLGQRPLYLDTETTGLDREAEIVEICLCDAEGRPLLDTLVRPTRRIPAAASAVHGITDAMVARAPAWSDVWPRVRGLIAGRTVGVYNAEYDLRLVRQDLARHGIRREPGHDGASAFCIMRMYASYRGDWNAERSDFRWQRLEAAREQLGLRLPNAHRARADALLARAVLHCMALGR